MSPCFPLAFWALLWTNGGPQPSFHATNPETFKRVRSEQAKNTFAGRLTSSGWKFTTSDKLIQRHVIST